MLVDTFREQNIILLGKTEKNIVFNNEPLLDYKYDSGRFFAANTDAYGGQVKRVERPVILFLAFHKKAW